MVHILAGSASDNAEFLEAAKTGGSLLWKVPKTSRVNDRALIYLWGFGFAARCIIASEPHEYKHGKYDANICEIAPLAAAVPLAFIQKNHPSWKWLSAYTKSYTTIDGPIEARLSDVLESYQASFAEPLTEGAFKSVSVTAYERNALARRQCIEHYGTACYACGFSFGETYGETADGYIHVHHLKAVSERAGRYVIDPIEDLRPICPNCHAVVHLQNPPLSIAELKRMLKEARSNA